MSNHREWERAARSFNMMWKLEFREFSPRKYTPKQLQIIHGLPSLSLLEFLSARFIPALCTIQIQFGENHEIPLIANQDTDHMEVKVTIALLLDWVNVKFISTYTCEIDWLWFIAKITVKLNLKVYFFLSIIFASVSLENWSPTLGCHNERLSMRSQARIKRQFSRQGERFHSYLWISTFLSLSLCLLHYCHHRRRQCAALFLRKEVSLSPSVCVIVGEDKEGERNNFLISKRVFMQIFS